MYTIKINYMLTTYRYPRLTFWGHDSQFFFVHVWHTWSVPPMRFGIHFLIWIDPGEALTPNALRKPSGPEGILTRTRIPGLRRVIYNPCEATYCLFMIWVASVSLAALHTLKCSSYSHFSRSQTLRICLPFPRFLHHLLLAHRKGNSVIALTSCPVTVYARLHASEPSARGVWTVNGSGTRTVSYLSALSLSPLPPPKGWPWLLGALPECFLTKLFFLWHSSPTLVSGSSFLNSCGVR